MKKFIVKGKNKGIPYQKTFTVDDSDAWLFRSYVWILSRSNGENNYYLKRKKYTGLGGKHTIFEKITENLVDGTGQVFHINGDCFDLRRINLKRMTRSEISKIQGCENKIMQLSGVRKIGEKL